MITISIKVWRKKSWCLHFVVKEMMLLSSRASALVCVLEAMAWVSSVIGKSCKFWPLTQKLQSSSFWSNPVAKRQIHVPWSWLQKHDTYFRPWIFLHFDITTQEDFFDDASWEAVEQEQSHLICIRPWRIVQKIFKRWEWSRVTK